MRVSSAALACCCTIALGCIPSHRMVHEGDTYFERCYAADFQRQVRPEQREACWQAWVAHYTRQQPAHRIDYALRRIESLQNGEPAHALPDLPNGGGAEQAEEWSGVDGGFSYASSSDYGSASPLGPVLLDGDAGPVANGCLSFCNEYESRCLARCPGNSASCRHGCERERAICLAGCY